MWKALEHLNLSILDIITFANLYGIQILNKSMPILLLICFFSPFFIYSQDTTIQYESHAPYSFGIIAGNGSIHNKAIVPVIPNSMSCGIYDNGNSSGLLLGVFGEYSLIPSFASISGRAYYAQHPGNLQSEECKYIVY